MLFRSSAAADVVPERTSDPVTAEPVTVAPKLPAQAPPRSSSAPTPAAQVPRPGAQAPTARDLPSAPAPRPTTAPAQPSAARASAPIRPTPAQKHKGPQAVRVESQTRPSGALTIGSKAKPSAAKKPAQKDLGGAGGRYAQHLEVDKSLAQTMHKDLSSGSSSQMPLVTLGGEKLGFLEHYAHEWNAARSEERRVGKECRL